MKRYCMTFWSPGTIVGESWTADVDEFPEPAAIQWPERAYAVQFCEQTVAEANGETLRGTLRSIGPLRYHPDSVVTTLAETERHPNATAILLDNMRTNNWDAVIWTRWGNWPQPWNAARMEIAPKAG